MGLASTIFWIFVVGIGLFIGALFNAMSVKKPGFYPPKRVLKRRAVLLAAMGSISFLLGMLLSAFK